MEKKQTTADVVVMEDLAPKIIANSIDMATSLDEKRAYAVHMIQSGLLPATLASPDQLIVEVDKNGKEDPDDVERRNRAIGAVIAVVEYGRELSITPWVALHGMHVVQGKVVMGIHMYMGLALKNNILVEVIRDHENVYRGEGANKKLVDRVTEIRITRKNEYLNVVKEYTFVKRWSEIVKAGLSQRKNYDERPVLMLRTRCITEGLRLYAADIFMGTYETTEMLDVTADAYVVDEDGNRVED